jgi:hypothetical protein
VRRRAQPQCGRARWVSRLSEPTHRVSASTQLRSACGLGLLSIGWAAVGLVVVLDELDDGVDVVGSAAGAALGVVEVAPAAGALCVLGVTSAGAVDDGICCCVELGCCVFAGSVAVACAYAKPIPLTKAMAVRPLVRVLILIMDCS